MFLFLMLAAITVGINLPSEGPWRKVAMLVAAVAFILHFMQEAKRS